MNLIDLNNQIHNADKAEFVSQRASWVSSITSELASASEADIEYFRNHTGRELIRKANLFGDTAFIKDDFDDGFRPKRVGPTTGLNGKIISWYDASDFSSHDLDSQNRVLKAYDKAGSFDLSTNKGINRTPTIDRVKFNDGRDRNIFFFPRSSSADNSYFRSYDFSHDFNSDGELNILIVLHHLKNSPGDSSAQDFIFEAANTGSASNPRVFLRRGNDMTASPNYNQQGLGSAFNFSESDVSFQLDQPANLLLHLAIKKGSQTLRVNGQEIKTASVTSLVNIVNNPLNGQGMAGGGIYWGSNLNSGQTLEGGFGEIILYNDFTEDGEFLESYLAKKWGFDVPTPKHFKTFV